MSKGKSMVLVIGLKNERCSLFEAIIAKKSIHARNLLHIGVCFHPMSGEFHFVSQYLDWEVIQIIRGLFPTIRIEN